MGFLDTIASFIPFTGSIDAEAPTKDESEENGSEVTKDESEEEDQDEEAKDEEDEEEEEEDEDEVEDPAEPIKEGEATPLTTEEYSDAFKACAESKACKPAKHHYDECAARVAEQTEKFGKPKEDCIEECKDLPSPQDSY
jgi:ubiquinol-cytochrome c reductase subunit 6